MLHIRSSRLTLFMSLLIIVLALIYGCQSVKPPQVSQQPTTVSVCPNCETNILPSTPTFQPEAPLWQTPAGVEEVLPAPLYFVSTRRDEKDLTCQGPHIVRIERDGRTRTVITPCSGIDGFDISPIDGSIVLVAKGGLWLVSAKSKESTLLLRASPNPEYSDSPIFNMQNPAWSPDGTKIAYEDDGGIRILDMATRTILHAIDHDMCIGEAEYFSFQDPCLYRGRYRILQWAADSKALLALHQEEDSRNFVTLTLNSDDKMVVPYIIDFHALYFHTIAWGKDGSTFLLDRYETISQEQNAHGMYALWRTNRDGSSNQLAWPYQERRNFLSLHKISENENIHNALETEDGRILFFLGGYLVELSPINNVLEARNVTKLSDLHIGGIWGWRWYKNGKYAAVKYESGIPIDNRNGYIGKEYIGVIEIETGKIYLLAEENMDSYPRASEDIYSEGNNHLIWGQP